jgi:pyruvate kinase
MMLGAGADPDDANAGPRARRRHTDEMIRQVDTSLTESGRIADGERVVIVTGSPPGAAGQTNMIRVRRIGAPL